MLHVLTLSLALTLSAAPADLAQAPVVEEPAPVKCADATLATPPTPLFLGFGDPIAPSVTCSVDCDGNGSEETSCTGSSCSAVERNCSIGQRGYVKCGTTYTYCPICPCTEGQIRRIPTGNCCDCYWNPGVEKDVEKCVNGVWVYQHTSCFPGGSCPICQ
jgi:hypothetical protein